MQFNFDSNDLKYIKLVIKDSNDNFFDVHTNIKNIYEQKIILNSHYTETFKIKLPQEVSVNVVCNEGLYKTQTTLEAIDYDKKYTYFTIKKPSGVEYQQKREYFRISADYKCTFYNDIDNNTDGYDTTTVDISANGVSIIVPQNIQINDETKFKIYINNNELKILAKLVRTEDFNSATKASFMYLNISETDRDIIAQACIKKQIEEKRQSMKKW